MCTGRAEDIWLGDYLFLNMECLLWEMMAFVTCRGCYFAQASMSVVQQGMEAMSHLWITQLKKIMKNLSQVSLRVLVTNLLYTRQTACLSHISELCSPSIASVCVLHSDAGYWYMKWPIRKNWKENSGKQSNVTCQKGSITSGMYWFTVLIC
jgi:hypothetical protein